MWQLRGLLMEQDFSKILTFEIKKELADRYFGFRKLIEEDIQSLNKEVKRQESTAEQKICHDLVRIYILLQAEGYIDEFFQLSGLEEDLFFDRYLLESLTIRKKLFIPNFPLLINFLPDIGACPPST